MSLAIEVDHVMEVLLKDGWHPVAANSFTIGTCEFKQKQGLLVEEGTVKSVSKTAATWKEPSGLWVTAPFSEILAVKSRAQKSAGAAEHHP